MSEPIGAPLDRVDGRRKVTGGAAYSADVALPNVAFAVLVTSTIGAGRIRRIDLGAARQVPGVLAILTPENAPRLASLAAGSSPPPTGRVVSLLQDDRVHYNGQPIGVVIADRLEQATHAASLVSVDYAASRPSLDVLAAAPTTHRPKDIVGQQPDSNRGDWSRALADAAVTVDRTYRTPLEYHNPMEPHATIAVWDAEGLTLYDSTQFVDGVRDAVARTFELPPERVRIVSHFIGGAFGGKGSPWSHVFLAAMAAKQAGRPVKLVLTRRQLFGPVGGRPITVQRLTLGARSDGELTGIRHESTSTTSVFEDWTEGAALATRMLYRSPTVLTRHRLVSLNLGTPTFQRAPGEASGTFALESAMDELAAELRMDPVDLRLKNYAEENEEEQKPWSSKTLRECYRIGAERFGWAKRSAKPRSMTDGRWLVGYGMATATYPTVRRPASSFVRLDLDEGGRPRAVVRAASHELGTGTYTILTQIVAATLGIAPDRIGCELGDTRFPPSPISAGSMTAASAGSAAFDAASEVRSRVIALAIADRSSPLFNQPRERVTLAGGRIALVGDPERGEPLETFLARHGDGVEARADSAPSPDAKHFSMHAFGAVFVEVKVDPELGIVRVPRVVAAYGAGRILNPKTARSQLLGGIVWGLGMGLFEEGLLDPRTGRVLNADLAEYLVPTNADVMDIDVTTVAERDEHVNPLGVKGIGEIGITGVAAALANAIHHATGIRVGELPITLDRLMAEPA